MFTPEEKADIRKRFLKIDTSNVGDVLDELGYPDQGLASDFTLQTAGGSIAGWAYTIRGQMTPYPLGGDADKMTACAGLSKDDISVWSGDGQGICYFGELIAIGMKERGCVGAVADGGIRDTRWIDAQSFPVMASYRTPVQSISRWKVTGWDIPVFLRGATSKWVTVNPGDFILGDADGGIVIPRALVRQVLEETEALTAKEEEIRKHLNNGLSLADALKQFGHV
ncbi:MAG TPA: RraA family protein [Burkholderiaceae bacterium]|nr:RraA family protein [Burkholderiaceae bacterium]